MRTSIFLSFPAIFLCLIFACNGPQYEKDSSISFKIDGYENDTIHFWQYEPLTYSKVNPLDLILDESGQGSTKITYPQHSFVMVNIGDFTFPLIHIMGSKLEIMGNASDLPNSLAISGKGSIPANYVKAKWAIQRKYDNLDGISLFQLDSLEYWERIAGMNVEIDSLNRWLSGQGMDPELEAMLQLESRQRSNFLILNYALMKGYIGAGFKVDMSYDKRLFESYSLDYSLLLELNYNFQLSGPAWVNSGAANSDSVAYLFPRIITEALDTLGMPEIARDYYTARLLVSYFEVNLSDPVLEEIYAGWKSSYPNSIYRDKISEFYNAMSSLAPGTRAPLISGVYPDGEAFSLESLRGNVVYIDVWATWCSPCREGLPKMYDLMERFKDNSALKFLFISVDRDIEKWQSYLSTLPAGGIHMNSESSVLYRDYMIWGVPHYIIIDKSGNIYSSNAPDPDSEEIIKILNELVFEKADES